jgi:hypothetical protein
MSLANSFPAAILETILIRLATLFLTGAGGDLTAARLAAAEMLADHHPHTAEELRLAAQIVSFSFHALEAPSQAAAPDLPLTRILRLRGNAVSLNRASDKAQRRLEQRPQARAQAAPPRPPEPAQPEPTEDTTCDAPQVTPAIQIRPQTHDQRQQDIRIAASLKRAEARIAAQSNPPPPRLIDHPLDRTGHSASPPH